MIYIKSLLYCLRLIIISEDEISSACITLGDYEVKWMPDGWTVVTADKSLAAHYENTILITDGEPEILSRADGIEL